MSSKIDFRSHSPHTRSSESKDVIAAMRRYERELEKRYRAEEIERLKGLFFQAINYISPFSLLMPKKKAQISLPALSSKGDVCVSGEDQGRCDEDVPMLSSTSSSRNPPGLRRRHQKKRKENSEISSEAEY